MREKRKETLGQAAARWTDDVRGWLDSALDTAKGMVLTPAVDVEETEDAVFVRADVPGVEPKDIDVSLRGQTLTLRGRKEQQTEQTGEGFRRIERRFGEFTRDITLPAGVDADRIEARCRNGVLTLRMPKSESSRSRRVPIDET